MSPHATRSARAGPPPTRSAWAWAAAIAVACAGVVAFARPAPAPWTGRVVKAADGDTVTVMKDGRGVRVRLYGIDTPEKAQPFGKAAKRFTLKRVAGKRAHVEPIDIDRYGRTVGLVTVGGDLVNEALVAAGYAWVYERYCKRRSLCERLERLQRRARKAKRGLWSDPNPTPPWSWRRGGSDDRRKDRARARGPFHGNVRSLKFHAPRCRHYDCKNCTKVFRTRAQAIDAGYEPCGGCRP